MSPLLRLAPDPPLLRPGLPSAFLPVFLVELPFQPADTLKQFGQSPEGDVNSLHFPVGPGRGSKPFLAVRNMVHHAGLGGDRHLVSNREMAGDPYLAGE